MEKKISKKPSVATRAIHGKQLFAFKGRFATSDYQTSTYRFETSKCVRYAKGDPSVYVYTRYHIHGAWRRGKTCVDGRRRVCGAVCVRYGANHYGDTSVTKAGDNIISTPALYGALIDGCAMITKAKYQRAFIDPDHLEEIAQIADKRTTMVFIETPPIRRFIVDHALQSITPSKRPDWVGVSIKNHGCRLSAICAISSRWSGSINARWYFALVNASASIDKCRRNKAGVLMILSPSFVRKYRRSGLPPYRRKQRRRLAPPSTQVFLYVMHRGIVDNVYKRTPTDPFRITHGIFEVSNLYVDCLIIGVATGPLNATAVFPLCPCGNRGFFLEIFFSITVILLLIFRIINVILRTFFWRGPLLFSTIVFARVHFCGFVIVRNQIWQAIYEFWHGRSARALIRIAELPSYGVSAHILFISLQVSMCRSQMLIGTTSKSYGQGRPRLLRFDKGCVWANLHWPRPCLENKACGGDFHTSIFTTWRTVSSFVNW